MGSLAAALWLLVKTQCGPTIDPQLLGSMLDFNVEQFWYENIITKNNQISNYYLAIDVQLGYCLLYFPMSSLNGECVDFFI